MRRGTDNGVYLRRYPRCLRIINMVTTTESRTAGSEVTPISLKRYVAIASAEVFSHPIDSNIRTTRHVVIQADGLTL
jgi:hypothetical protein